MHPVKRRPNLSGPLVAVLRSSTVLLTEQDILDVSTVQRFLDKSKEDTTIYWLGRKDFLFRAIGTSFFLCHQNEKRL